MEYRWKINLTGTLPDGHTPDLTITRAGSRIMRVAFRADASIQIGTGHVMRCLTLADALRLRGHTCTFVCRDHPGNLVELIAQKGFEVRSLSLPVPVVPDLKDDAPLAHADWLGVSWQQDAEQTMGVLAGEHFEWLVVDHYALDVRWERWVASIANQVMAIDDLADRPHGCHLLLDQNLGRQSGDYAHWVPEGCLSLIGPRYALLRPEFAELRAQSLERRQGFSLKRILVTLGGVDRDNITGQVLEALAQSRLPNEAVLDVVMGASAPALDAVRKQVETLPFRVSVSVNVTDMAERMCLADLCIGAAGSTSWERCCLGLPTILVVLAGNQESGARALDEAGAARVIGCADGLGESLPDLVDKLSLSGELVDMADKAAAVTDGTGTSLVVDAMLRLSGGVQ
jgi:UDP-2,4-diacetamido-2,4,6-trideoxy-beta-L-altropyranose hydrolase